MGYAVPGRPPQPISTCTQLTPEINQAVLTSTIVQAGSTCSTIESRSLQIQNQEHYTSEQASACFTPVLPPSCTLPDILDIAINEDSLPAVPTPAKPLLRPSTLPDTCFVLPGSTVFVDKILPALSHEFSTNSDFPTGYFVAMHTLVSTPTAQYGAYTPNYLGARIPLQHTKLRIDRWKYHLVGYEGADITQFLQFGFPLGLSESPPPALVSTLRNHGSSYQFFTHIDEFLKTGLERGELAGPFWVQPFKEVHVNPL